MIITTNSLATPSSSLRDVAEKLEAQFLEQMLKTAEPEQARGGHAEEQFSSFLTQYRAEAMVARGGIGLAEQIVHALQDRSQT